MRVVWITHNYPRHRGDVSGAFLHPLAVALRRRGIDVRVVAPSDAGQGGRDELDGVPVNRVRYGTVAEEQLAYRGTMAGVVASPRSLLAFNRLRAALRSGATEQLDAGTGDALVHAHWWVPGGLAAPASAPMVLTCHGTDVRLLDRVPFAGLLARPVFRRARVVTTVSHQLAATIHRRTGVAIEADAIQPMPVAAVDRPWSDGSGDIVVVGRLSRQKRVSLALDAMAIALPRGLNRRLTVVGDGPMRPALERQTLALGLGEAVRFVGEIPPAGVPAVLATASCCLMPAQDEGFGLSAAEALMQGVPVVACLDGGGLRDIVPMAGSGRTVAADAAAIAEAMLELLCDPQARDAARAEGAQWRARLSPDFVADRCLTWYQRALHA
jgi:glycosyltransferase involved in cell wall biosynthesis